jgi:hypothetical protein
MKKEILVNCVITINKNGLDKWYDADMLSDFKTAQEIIDYFNELIREDKIQSFWMLDSHPQFVGGSYECGNVVKGINGCLQDDNYEPFPVKFVE